MTWLSVLTDWFSPSAKRRSASRHAQKLVAQQLGLTEDIERTREALDRRLQELAGRLHEMTGDEAEDELRSIERMQMSLRLALQRLEASAKTTQELTRELKEWEDRGDRERAEILRSELVVRDPSRLSLPKEHVSVGAQLIAPIRPADRPEGVINHAPTEMEIEQVDDRMPDTETEHLVRAIREATREAERWHAMPTEEHDEELIEQIHHVRELNALLKQIDREQGRDRDRIALAVQPREIH